VGARRFAEADAAAAEARRLAQAFKFEKAKEKAEQAVLVKAEARGLEAATHKEELLRAAVTIQCLFRGRQARMMAKRRKETAAAQAAEGAEGAEGAEDSGAVGPPSPLARQHSKGRHGKHHKGGGKAPRSRGGHGGQSPLPARAPK
jgi:hypothetical protein